MTMPYVGNLYDTVSMGGSSPLKCVQTFLGDPTTYNCASVSAAEKQLTAEYCVAHDTTFYVHCPLITNLAKTRGAGQSIRVVSDELDVVAGLPAACVLHVGKHLNGKGSIETLGRNINDLELNGHLPRSHHQRVPFHLLLEIAAGQGTELGRNWEEIRHLYEALDYTRVGLCIDTQHAYASGMCEFQTHEQVVKLFDSAGSIVHRGVSMVHLNDSEKPFGSQVDRHAPLTRGYIWNRNQEGLKSLVNLSKDIGMDLISETSDPLADNLLVAQYMRE
jgi:deoxyribonuclease-4